MQSTDAKDRVAWTIYDSAGRTVRTIQNFQNGTVEETDRYQDNRVDYTYDSKGRLATMTAYNAKGAGIAVEQQATKYLYTSTINASWQTAVVYPESTDTVPWDSSNGWTIASGSDHTSTQYDRLGRTTQTTDQNNTSLPASQQRGVSHTYSYDSSGRLALDAVTVPTGSTGVDQSILSIKTEYDHVGRVRLVSSCSNAAGTTIVNQVQYMYNSWGKVSCEYQEHNGAVNTDTSLAVQYSYSDGLTPESTNQPAKYVRLTEVDYPNGRKVHYDYSAVTDDIMSRLSSIYDDANDNEQLDTGEDVYASYKYLGRGTIVEEDYVESQTKLTYLDSSNNVTGLDRFGRVVDQVWKDYDSTPDTIDEYTYTYDRAGNRLTKTNTQHTAFNETYTYDGLDRLLTMDRANGTTDDQSWTLDSLGNNLAAGTYNAANEETPTQGSSAYDATGNMITLQSGNSAIYDAWNRMVKVKSGTTTIQQNEYDGTNRRIQIFSSFSGSTATVQDDYYVGQQVVESDVTNGYNMTTGGGTRNGGYQMIWSPRYVDSLILRDTLNTAGTAIVPTQRVFYLSDANYNVTGLVKYDSGVWKVAERYTYSAYGVVTYRNADWTTATSSANSNTTLYTGRTLDLLTSSATSSFYYYRARFYDAGLERFVNRDPIGYRGGLDMYEYVRDNPTDYTDPTGLARIPIRRDPNEHCDMLIKEIKPDCNDTVTIISRHTPDSDQPNWEKSGIGGSIFPGVGSAGQIPDILEKRASEGCDCIKTLNISGHGYYGIGISLAPGYTAGINQNTDPAILTRIAKQLCKGATVNLKGCGTGNEAGLKEWSKALGGIRVCGCNGNMDAPDHCKGDWICWPPA